MARRDLDEGFELDDDPARIDVAAVHAYLSLESYWGRGRSRARVERAIRGSTRVVGLYRDGRQVGFARCVTDGAVIGYLADVYVLAECRGRGLGLELVREAIEGSASPEVRWLLHTRDAQGLYEKLGFGPDRALHPLMERPPEAGETHEPRWSAAG